MIECFEQDHCWSVTSSCQFFDANRMPPYEFLGNMWSEQHCLKRTHPRSFATHVDKRLQETQPILISHQDGSRVHKT